MRPNRPIWLDAHLPPALAPWLMETFSINAVSFDRLGFRTTADEAVFAASRSEAAIIMTKDADFPRLLSAKGPPPAIIWLTFGNTSLFHLKALLESRLKQAPAFFEDGKGLVEIAAD